MSNQENLEQTGTSFFGAVENLFKKIKPVHVVCAVLPMILIYPKPLMYILRPIIRNWSFHYRTINKVSSKPTEIILTSNPHLSFEKEYINKFIVVKGTLPESFRLIGESIINEDQLRQNEDESMKHVLIKKKYEFQKQRILGACYVIDMQDIYLEISRSQPHYSNENEKRSQASTSLQQKRTNQEQVYTQIDYIWVEMIEMKLKLLQLENNSEAIKHVIIKANERVLQLLEAKILGIKSSQAFKLGVVGENKIHLLKFNKAMDTYEHCSATFKIQQREMLKQD